MSEEHRYYPSWTMGADVIARARESVHEGDVERELSLGGFSENWISSVGFAGTVWTPAIGWGYPLIPAQVVAVADGLAEPVGSGERYRITDKGLARLRENKAAMPMFVRGRCEWQGRKDGYTVFQTVHRQGEPTLRIPSRLSAAPWDQSGGIFGNAGALLTRENVALLRDQLTAWLEEHAATEAEAA